SESNIDQTRPEEVGLDTAVREEVLGPTLAAEDGVNPMYPEEGLGPTLAGDDGVAPTYSEDGVDPTLAAEDGVDPTLAGEVGVDPTLAGEDGVDPTLAEEHGSSQGHARRTVSTATTRSTAGSDAENDKVVTINRDTLPTPSIIIISATPFERELEEDTVEIEETIIPEPSSSSTEKRVSKQVSFNDASIEEVIIIPQSHSTTKRASLDESTLVLAEKRKMDEETWKMSIKKAESIDMVIKSASKVLEELRQANEAEVAAKIDAFDPSADATTVTATEIFADTKRDERGSHVKRHLGATAYREIFRKVKPPEIKKKIPGADWALQQKSQKYFSKPPILYWEQWKINNLKKNYLGPGSYEMKDFIQLGNAKPRSERGICDNLGPRFDKATQSVTPGPGTYGIGGVPHRALEDRANRSFSTRGMLDAGDRKRNLPYQGCDLAPGTYEQKSFVDELLNKVTGLRGPYDLFTARRKDPVKTGFYPTPKRSKIGPGYYKYKSFVDELTSSKYNLRGRFSRQAQYPEVPTERFLLFSKATPSLDKETPGPGAYDVKELPKYTPVNPPAFLSSSSRNDKMSEKIFSMTCHPVGPGRYFTEKFEDQYVNGHTNVFKSKTGQPSLKMARFNEERLKSKQRNVEVSSCYPGKTNRTITGM
ncbi:unnamed protein product, partial [Candidula unifasciata]